MASAAEQMASNMSWGAFGRATELRQRILFTLGLLIVYRLGTYIPVPGIDGIALRQFMDDAASGIGGILSMFTGGALARMGIFALGIMPYISASIIIQLLSAMWEPLKQLKKEGEQGRKKINQYTRYGTVLLATFQSYGLAVSLEAGDLASDPGLYFRISCMITLVGGTMFLMWLGEQITARGIGNGISLIIFVGIIAEIPAAMAQFLSQGRSGAISPAVIIGVFLMVVATLTFVVFMERALRKIHIQYPRRQVGMKVYDGGCVPPAGQGQPGRRDPRDLRQRPAAAAHHARHVQRPVGHRPGDVHDPRLFRAGPAALPHLHGRRWSCSSRFSTPKKSRSRSTTWRTTSRTRTASSPASGRASGRRNISTTW